MKRLLALATAVYVPHLVEEALTGMHDDPIIVHAFTVLAELSPRHASYLVFQIMLALVLVTTLAWAMGGPGRLAVIAALGVALVGEGHHILSALYTLHYNSGLITALPMPFVGAYLLKGMLTCSRTSSSPWASVESSSGSHPSSPQAQARA